MQQHPARVSSQIANVQGEHHENRECFGLAFTSRVLAFPPAFAARPCEARRSRQTDFTIYDEALASGWQNWSWATVDTRQHGECQYGSRLDRRHAGGLVGALPAFRRRAGRHPRLPEFHVLCPRRNHRRTDHPGQCVVGQRRAQAGVRVASPTAGTWQKITVPLAALGVDNRTDVNGFWFQEIAGVDSTHLLRRHRRAGVRRSAHAAAAGQRHGHLPGCARQRLEQLELGLRQHRQHDDGTHGIQRNRRRRPMASRRCTCSTPPCPPTRSRA